VIRRGVLDVNEVFVGTFDEVITAIELELVPVAVDARLEVVVPWNEVMVVVRMELEDLDLPLLLGMIGPGSEARLSNPPRSNHSDRTSLTRINITRKPRVNDSILFKATAKSN
jgi:hypothetical protein